MLYSLGSKNIIIIILNCHIALVARSLGLVSITIEAIVILASISVLLSGILSKKDSSRVEVG
jgi:hypothetical protein